MGEVAKCRVSSGFCLPEVIHSGLFLVEIIQKI